MALLPRAFSQWDRKSIPCYLKRTIWYVSARNRLHHLSIVQKSKQCFNNKSLTFAWTQCNSLFRNRFEFEIKKIRNRCREWPNSTLPCGNLQKCRQSVEILNYRFVWFICNRNGFFKKWTNPGLFFVYFSVFSNISAIFSTIKCQKWSI